MSIRLTAGALFVAFVLPATAGAVTAVSPVNNAAADLHPLLAWSLAASETSDSVTIADSPATTPAGEFLTEHVVTGDVFFDNTTRWAPTSPLMAGTYWWSVSADDAAFNTTRTPPAPLHVNRVLTHAHFRITRIRFP